ncbi:MAG: type IV pilus assembly protein PilM [Bacillota bacterium]
MRSRLQRSATRAAGPAGTWPVTPTSLPSPPSHTPRSTVVGVDIGHSYTKLVQVKRGASASAPPSVLNFAILPTPPGCMVEGKFTDPGVVGGELRRIWRLRRVRQKQVVSVLLGAGVILRHADFPAMPEQELKNVVKLQSEEHIPIPAAEVILDHFVVGRGEQDGTVRVLMAGAQRGVVDTHVKVFEQAGLTLTALEVDSLALIRAAGHNGYLTGASPHDLFAVLDFGAAATRLCLFSADSPQLTRNIGPGGQRLTEAVAKAASSVLQRAEQMKCEDGLTGSTLVRDALLDPLNESLTECRRTLEYFFARGPRLTLKGVFLAGGGANMAGLADLIQPFLEGVTEGRSLSGGSVVVDKLDCLNHITLDRKYEPVRRAFGPEFSVALGLALREEPETWQG